MPHAAPFDAVTTSTVLPIEPFSLRSTENVRTARWSASRRLTSLPTKAPSRCARAAGHRAARTSTRGPVSTPAASTAAERTLDAHDDGSHTEDYATGHVPIVTRGSA